MTVNKQYGNMYPFVTHTWNPIRGKCPHKCSYCYMKKFPQKQLRLDTKCLMDKLGKDKFIFVGSSTDMFAEDVPYQWICDVLIRCKDYPDNKYLFQTKNPRRFKEFIAYFEGLDVILGTTVESNIPHDVSEAPDIPIRLYHLGLLKQKKMVSIEPVMNFNENFVDWILQIHPEFVSIGADSQGHNLPEPSTEMLKALISELQKHTKVIIKDNLKRIVKP